MGTGFSISNWMKEDVEEKNECCEMLNKGRDRAEDTALKMLLALSQSPIDPTAGSDLFASYFNRLKGVYSTVLGNFEGRVAIAAQVALWGTAGNDTNLTIVPRKFFWDAKRSTLVVELRWHATALNSREFLDNNGSVVFYPEGTAYTQDDAVIIRFDCHNKVVYYRDYYDGVQRLSTYTRHYAPACSRCAHREKSHPFIPDTDAPTEAPTVAPTETPTPEPSPGP